MSKASDAQLRAAEKYDRANTVRMSIKLNKRTDADILAALDCSGNKQGLIKAAVREYINKNIGRI